MNQKKRKTIFLIGTRWFGILGQSQILIKELLKKDFEIYIFGQRDKYYQQFKVKKINLIELNIKPSYFSPFSDILDLSKIFYHIILLRPSVIHTFNPKPMIYGYIVTSLSKRIKLFIAQTGIGNLFEKNKILIPFISFLIKKAHKKSEAVFFHNKFDSHLFLKKGLIKKSKVVFIGPCVDVNKYLIKNKKSKKNFTRVICISRLLNQKGVMEYLAVANKYKKESNRKNVEFLLVGEIEKNHYDRIDQHLIEDAEEKKIIKRISWSNNIKLLLKKSDILFLHSYREGGPRVIVEAAASQIPTVGSDAIGVRDLIINNKTGFITKVKNVNLAYKALKKLIDNKKLLKNFGKNALNLIAKPISLEKATEKQLSCYKNSKII